MKRIPKLGYIVWIFTILLILGIKIFSLDAARVERDYSNGLYPKISTLFVGITNWIPFSLGDLLYFAIAIWLLIKIFKNVNGVCKYGFKRKHFFYKLKRALLLSSWIYIIFNIFWGLNYNREGISAQLQFATDKYSVSDLDTINKLLLERVNASRQEMKKSKIDSISNKVLFAKASEAYWDLEKKYPFLKKSKFSIKQSLYSRAGNYLGFTGYFNPFTGEAQANTSVPNFLRPYIATHELAHELGYAKEDEANFVGYLAASNSADPRFHYSTYLDLFLYANRELYSTDSVLSKTYFDLLSPDVKGDIEVWRQFNRAHQSFIEPSITWLYSKFLKLNQQPKGIRSYNHVVAMLIAFNKKYGTL